MVVLWCSAVGCVVKRRMAQRCALVALQHVGQGDARHILHAAGCEHRLIQSWICTIMALECIQHCSALQFMRVALRQVPPLAGSGAIVCLLGACFNKISASTWLHALVAESEYHGGHAESGFMGSQAAPV